MTLPLRLPLSRPLVDRLVADAELAAESGAFLCFVMIPVEERLGEWRFAGTATRLGDAVARLRAFMRAIGLPTDTGDPLREWLGALDLATAPDEAWSYDNLPLREIGEHRVILLAEGGAPYDDAALCILDVFTLAGSAFAGRSPETERPAAWDAPDPDDE